MGFFSKFFDRRPEGVEPNSTTAPGTPPTVGSTDFSPGDPDGVDLSAFADIGLETRSLPSIVPSGWDGWPAEWDMPAWGNRKVNELVDVAFAALDLNSRALATMPAVRKRDGVVLPPQTWMSNPDPRTYNSLPEFVKQLVWDYQLGEAFVLPVATGADGFPLSFRVIPPWMVDVTMAGSSRRYRLGGVGGPDVSDQILHIPYQITSDCARGRGPLDVAGHRVVTAGVLARYVRDVVAVGGVPYMSLETDQSLTPDQAQDAMHQWVESRVHNNAAPPVLDNGVKLNIHKGMTPKDLSMQEIAGWTEARIAVLLGVQPVQLGLPQSSESLTYQNVAHVNDFHWRSSLRPMAEFLMQALSAWALPGSQRIELDRDEYTRPPYEVRAEAHTKLVAQGIESVDEAREDLGLIGPAPAPIVEPAPAAQLTGGEQ